MFTSKRTLRAPIATAAASVLERLEPRRLLADVGPLVQVDIDPDQLYQEWEGFGASMMDWFNGGAYDDPDFYNAMVTDLGASMVRLPLNPAFEATNDNGDASGIDWDGFNSEAVEASLRFAQELQKRAGDDFKTLTTLWTAPWWMKTNATNNFGGSLRPDMREEFAEYLVAYVKTAERDFGVPIDVISIQNEPFFFAPFQSTLYTPTQIALTLKVVADRFELEGIDTRVMLHEDLGVGDRWDWWAEPIVSDPETQDMNYMWGTHWTSADLYDDMQSTVRETGKPLWLTEAGGKGADHWLAALRFSEDIGGMMTHADISAFFEWQYDAEYQDDPTSSLWSDGEPTHRYLAMRHYSRWIRPGARRTEITYTPMDVDQNKQRDVFATSFYNEQLDAQTVVLTNNYSIPLEFKIDIAGDRSADWRGWLSTSGAKFADLDLSGQDRNELSIMLPARSMVTLYDGQSDPVLGTPADTGRGKAPLVEARDTARFHPLRQNSLPAYYGWMEQLINTENVHEEYINGRDALFLAAASPNAYAGKTSVVVDAIQLLIDYGAEVNKQDNEGITPLMVAASNPMLWFESDPYTSVLKLKTLIDNGADLSIKDDMGRTALHWAAQNTRWLFEYQQPHDARFLQYLLDQGADINKVDRFGMTPLMWANAEGATGNAAALAAWNSDTAAPEILAGGLGLDSGLQIHLDFDEAMGTLSASQFELLPQLADGSFGAPVGFTFATTTLAAGNTRVSLTPNSRLVNGYYVARAKAGGATDAAGNAVAEATGVPFWFLNADANRDKVVDGVDYNILMDNFGQEGVGFAGGDFDFNGRVDMDDWALLEANWGISLAEPTNPDDPPADPGDPPPPGDGQPLPPAPNPGGDPGGDPGTPPGGDTGGPGEEPVDPDPPGEEPGNPGGGDPTPPGGRPGGPAPEPPIPPGLPDDPAPPSEGTPPGTDEPGTPATPPKGLERAALARRIAGGAGRNVPFKIAREMGVSAFLDASGRPSAANGAEGQGSSVLTGLPQMGRPLDRLAFASSGPIRVSELLFDERETFV